MKAKELLKKIKGWDINEETYDDLVLKDINQFKKEVCEKQREICADEWGDIVVEILRSNHHLDKQFIKGTIETAPESD